MLLRNTRQVRHPHHHNTLYPYHNLLSNLPPLSRNFQSFQQPSTNRRLPEDMHPINLLLRRSINFLLFYLLLQYIFHFMSWIEHSATKGSSTQQINEYIPSLIPVPYPWKNLILFIPTNLNLIVMKVGVIMNPTSFIVIYRLLTALLPFKTSKREEEGEGKGSKSKKRKKKPKEIGTN